MVLIDGAEGLHYLHTLTRGRSASVLGPLADSSNPSCVSHSTYEPL